MAPRGGVAVDIDERSLASARRNLAPFPTIEVMRASAYDLPFDDRFDVAFSIGVIHHLEHPERALESMARAVKPGGRVLIWVYGRENNRWLVSVLDPLRRALFSRIADRLMHHLSLYPAALVCGLLLRLGLRPIDYFRLLGELRFSAICARSCSTRCCRGLLITGRARRWRADERGRPRGRQARLGKSDVLVGDRHTNGPGRMSARQGFAPVPPSSLLRIRRIGVLDAGRVVDCPLPG